MQSHTRRAQIGSKPNGQTDPKVWWFKAPAQAPAQRSFVHEECILPRQKRSCVRGCERQHTPGRRAASASIARTPKHRECFGLLFERLPR